MLLHYNGPADIGSTNFIKSFYEVGFYLFKLFLINGVIDNQVDNSFREKWVKQNMGTYNSKITCALSGWKGLHRFYWKVGDRICSKTAPARKNKTAFSLSRVIQNTTMNRTLTSSKRNFLIIKKIYIKEVSNFH